jgi:hypothetical protein
MRSEEAQGRFRASWGHIKGNLEILRARAAKTGVPYQRLLNQFLNSALQNDAQTESRLDRLEKEISRLKRKIVA